MPKEERRRKEFPSTELNERGGGEGVRISSRPEGESARDIFSRCFSKTVSSFSIFPIQG